MRIRFSHLLVILGAVVAPFVSADEPTPSLTADEALARLVEGNRRFTSGEVVHPHQTAARRIELAKGQSPIAVVVTCSDSRVSPELYFDQGLGDLFVIRNAGNVIDDHVLGSIEYAVEHLHVSLIVIVGHEKCGAVAATVAGGKVPGHIGSIVESIAPAIEAAKDQPGDKVDNTVRANARHSADQVCHDEPMLGEAIHSGKVKVVSARYELATGRVEIL